MLRTMINYSYFIAVESKNFYPYEYVQPVSLSAPQMERPGRSAHFGDHLRQSTICWNAPRVRGSQLEAGRSGRRLNQVRCLCYNSVKWHQNAYTRPDVNARFLRLQFRALPAALARHGKAGPKGLLLYDLFFIINSRIISNVHYSTNKSVHFSCQQSYFEYCTV